MQLHGTGTSDSHVRKMVEEHGLKRRIRKRFIKTPKF